MNSEIKSIERIGEKATVCEPPPNLQQLLSPPFVANRWIRGGHLQSVMSLRGPDLGSLHSILRWVELADGDRLAMFDDSPPDWRAGDASLLVVHGLCGCSESPYMLRLASRFTDQGVRVFRLNLRGCGVGLGAARQITHAGRSADVVAALELIAALTRQGTISAIGVSLGGNQILRALGLPHYNDSSTCERIATAGWQDRIHRIAAVSPPIDLKRCSDNMERLSLRPYNRYFIRYLLQRAPEALKYNDLIIEALRRLPKTMRELDERVTAPLGGYRNGIDYYHRTAATHAIANIQVPTLILASADDPIVPVSCFDGTATSAWPDSIRLVITKHGGHVGFIGQGKDRHWMDGLLDRWFEFDRLKKRKSRLRMDVAAKEARVPTANRSRRVENHSIQIGLG